MKYLILITLLFSHTIFAKEPTVEFFVPKKENAYQGRLFYDPTKEEYPIAKMRSLCKSFTGVDTAQTKCKDSSDNTVICDYLCSMHWMANEK